MHHRPPSPTNAKPPRPPPLSDPPTPPEHKPTNESLLHSPSPKPTSAVEKYYSPLTSPLPVTPPVDPTSSPPPHHIISFNRREEPPPHTGVVYGSGEGERKEREWKREDLVKKVELGVRVLEIVFCLVSFSVMAADKTQGWSGDSFDRYKEYRFCLTVSIMGFVYSGFQAYDLAYHLSTGKHVVTHHLRYHFDFILDQILAYLLISASSAAASRVNDWESNWGKDEFTEKASASVSMAFLAFIAFAISSMISGYNLCNRDLS